jgi:hypothetical protein
MRRERLEDYLARYGELECFGCGAIPVPAGDASIVFAVEVPGVPLFVRPEGSPYCLCPQCYKRGCAQR